MSWHCSQEPEGGFSLPDYLAGLRSARSRSNLSDARYSTSVNETESSNPSRSGTTFGHSTGDPGEDSLTLCPEGSRAKTSARRVKVEDLPETVRAFGSSLNASLERCGLALSSRKTVRDCVPVDSAPYSKDLPAWGMTFNGVCWELGTSVSYTSEPECGWLPTPSGVRGENKNHVAGRLDEWGGSSNRFRGTSLGPVHCPDFEEWVMGWPEAWTAPIPFEMDKFHSWQQQHSAFFQKGPTNDHRPS